MSLNTVIAFALLLKKITRKGSMGKKNFRNKMRKSSKPTVHTTTTMVSLSSSSDDEEEVQDFQYNNDDYNLMNNKKSNSSIIAPSIKSLQQQQKHNSLKQPLDDLITIVSPQPSEKKSITVISLSTESTESESNISVKRVQTENELCQDEAITTAETIDSDQMTIVPSTAVTDEVLIRDFAYPTESPLHYGKSLKPKYSSVSLSSPDFNGREARALFDFTPETEYELPLKTGQTIWVQYRQCSGWLIADVQDETGLIPESYVEFI